MKIRINPFFSLAFRAIKPRWKNIVFDYGTVLVGWQPKELFNRLLKEGVFTSRKDMKNFIRTLNSEFIPSIDVAPDLSEFVRECSARYPHWANAARAYRERWTEQLGCEVKGMHRIVERLKNAGCGVYGLTNWNRETFDRSRKLRPIMNLIPDTLVSGDHGYGKPEARFYKLLESEYGIDLKQCVFVDDKIENVKAAEELGMKGILFKNTAQLKRELRKLISNEKDTLQ